MTHPDGINGVLEAAVYVDDLDAAEGFYAGVIGLAVITHRAGRHVFFRCGPSVILAFNADATRMQPKEGALPVPTHGATGPGHVCISVEGRALDEWVAHFEAAGIAVEADFLWPNGARSIYVRDPAGNSVEMAEPRLWAA